MSTEDIPDVASWVVPHSVGPRFPGPLLIRTRWRRAVVRLAPSGGRAVGGGHPMWLVDAVDAAAARVAAEGAGEVAPRRVRAHAGGPLARREAAAAGGACQDGPVRLALRERRAGGPSFEVLLLG